jgi:flagellar FliJ protein
MKKFQFRLQSLLLVRETTERRLREVFFAKRHASLVAEGRVREANGRREAALEEMRHDRAHSLSAWGCVQRFSGLTVIEEDIARLRTEAAERAKERDEARRDWVEARKQLKVVERLREKAQETHAQEMQKAEQAMLDELSVLRRTRSSPTSIEVA